jgi:chorismate dehydratase
MKTPVSSASNAAGSRPLRVGSVSYLNAKPLIYGLEEEPTLKLCLDVPAKLLSRLQAEEIDVALLPVIDYQRLDNLRILTSGGIGCDGPTLTVRIFSSVPIPEIRRLACDVESHTSVALAEIVMAETYGIRPQIIPLDREHIEVAEAKLLIGDKVVCEEPVGLTHQLDLGAAWKALTGMPFIFAAWVARGGIDLGDLPARLEEAKRRGLENVDQIIAEHGTPRGWPAGLARQYLTHYLKYDIREKHLAAIRKFHSLAHRHGLIGEPRELVAYR